MNNREYAEVLICVAGDIVHSSAASDAFRSMIRSGMHGKLSTNDIHKRVLDAEYAASARIDSIIDAIDGVVAPMKNKELREDILSYTPDQLADQLLALAKRLLHGDAAGDVDGADVGGTGDAGASPTLQEPARAAIKGPVVVMVGGAMSAGPIGVELERAMAEAGIPGRVVGARITVDRGDVEWEVRHDGEIVVRWWPVGR